MPPGGRGTASAWLRRPPTWRPGCQPGSAAACARRCSPAARAGGLQIRNNNPTCSKRGLSFIGTQAGQVRAGQAQDLCLFRLHVERPASNVRTTCGFLPLGHAGLIRGTVRASIMMTARLMVRRVTPPMKAPAPISANAPGSTHAQGLGGRKTPGGALRARVRQETHAGHQPVASRWCALVPHLLLQLQLQRIARGPLQHCRQPHTSPDFDASCLGVPACFVAPRAESSPGAVAQALPARPSRLHGACMRHCLAK